MPDENAQKKINKSKKVATLELTREKKIIFSILLISIPIILILCLEIVLRITNYGGDSELFVSAPDESSKFYGINLHIGQRYFYYFGKEYDPIPRKDLFLKEKPENGVRIFVLGASTTAGFPFGDNVSFPRILQRYLMKTFPDKYIEVVNTAITSINSYALLDFIDEILQQSPDLILIYAGHNEFYGPFGPAAKVSLGSRRELVKLVLELQHYKTYILFRNIIISGMRDLVKPREQNQVINAEFKAKTYVPYGSRKYRAGLKQFEKNLDEIARKCRKAEVPLIFSELVSNIRDQKPFDSISNDSLPPANAVFKAAQEQENIGNYNEANKLYLRAKDLDPIRFRAPEEFNEIIHRLGNKYNISVVPMSEYFGARSPHGLIGDEIILDHVHPTLMGYFIMAEAFYKTMYQARFIDSQWTNYIENPASEFSRDWGFSELDWVYSDLVVQNLKSGWPFRSDRFSTISGEYLLNHFKPKDKLDSIALLASTNPNYGIQMGHLDLGKYYEGEGELDKALKEYRALIYSVPTMDFLYKYALNIYLKNKQYESANYLMQEAIKFNQSAYNYKWLGQTFLPLGKITEGINYLILAYRMNPKDNQVLFNITRAYYSISNVSEGDKYLKKYQELFPNDPNIQKLKTIRQIFIKK